MVPYPIDRLKPVPENSHILQTIAKSARFLRPSRPCNIKYYSSEKQKYLSFSAYSAETTLTLVSRPEGKLSTANTGTTPPDFARFCLLTIARFFSILAKMGARGSAQCGRAGLGHKEADDRHAVKTAHYNLSITDEGKHWCFLNQVFFFAGNASQNSSQRRDTHAQKPEPDCAKRLYH